MTRLLRRKFAFGRARRGFSLLDVMFAAVTIAMGMLFIGRFFSSVFEQLNPRGTIGGLRRYLMAEEMLRAQAEGLRILQVIPTDAGMCRLITPPVGLGFTFVVTPYIAGSPGTDTAEKLHFFDLTMTHDGQTVGTLGMSTLRSTVTNDLEKIGL